MIMTPHQVFAVAALGGFAALVALVLVVALGAAVARIVGRLVDRVDDYRARRAEQRAAAEQPDTDDLDTCRAIDALGTTRHPTED